MYDIIIKNTKIVDGTGKKAFTGNIAIKDEKIVSIGKFGDMGDVIINGKGLISCPGFIDPHNHADMTFMILPLCYNFIMQGITSTVGGNCGLSEAPRRKLEEKSTEKKVGFEAWQSQTSTKDLNFNQWLSKVERRGISVNYIPLIGHNAVRGAVMGENYKRHSTHEEIGGMKKLVEEGMRSGAFGFSTGLDYDPSEYCDTEEIIELAKVAKKYGGIYASHLRFCQSQWATSDINLCGYGVFHGPIEDAWIGKYKGLMEAFEVGKKANIPVQVSHIYTVYPISQPHPDFLDEAGAKATLWLFDKAREDGLDVTFDVIVSDTSISVKNLIINEFLLSRSQKLTWIREIGKEKFKDQLKDEKFREKLRALYNENYIKFGMIHTKADPYWMNRFKIMKCEIKDFENKTIREVASQLKKDAFDTVLEIILKDPNAEWVQFDEDRAINNRTLPIYLAHALSMPCTDMMALPSLDFPLENLKKIGTNIPEEFLNSVNAPHFYGMYASYIDKYVKDSRTLTIEDAVRKATSFVAQRFGITDRGVLKQGAWADILIFDYDKVKMTSDLLNPRQAPQGIEYVLVNGQITYVNKEHTGLKAGKVLRHEIKSLKTN